MNKKTNKEKHNVSSRQPLTVPLPNTAQREVEGFQATLGDPTFDDLQALFDEQDRRLSAILACPEAHPCTLNPSHAGTIRRRMFWEWAASAMFCTVLGIGWGIALWHYNYDIYFLVFNLFLEAVYIGLVTYAILSCRSVLRHKPDSTSFDSMLSYAQRRDILAPSLQHKKSNASSFVVGVQKPSFNLSRVASVVIAATCTLAFISCSTGAGDGYTMTKFDRTLRMECINNVDELISNINNGANI